MQAEAGVSASVQGASATSHRVTLTLWTLYYSRDMDCIVEVQRLEKRLVAGRRVIMRTDFKSRMFVWWNLGETEKAWLNRQDFEGPNTYRVWQKLCILLFYAV